jgi:hypothetical protein
MQLPKNPQNDFDSIQWRLSSAQEVQLPKKNDGINAQTLAGG